MANPNSRGQGAVELLIVLMLFTAVICMMRQIAAANLDLLNSTQLSRTLQ